MQAILTKYLPATSSRGSRIKASCGRGSLTINYPHELSNEDAHREAVKKLLARFRAEDKAQYGDIIGPWNCEFVTGGLPNNMGYAHVLIL